MRGLGLLAVPLLVAASAFEAVAPIGARQVEVVAVDEPPFAGPEDETLVVTGHVTTDGARVAHVSSPVTGRVARVHARLAQRVKKGDPLVTVEAPDMDPTSDVYKAEADLIAARHDLKRKHELFAMGESRADYEAAIHEAREAEAKLVEVRKRYRPLTLLRIADPCPPHPCTYTVRSPIDGEVLRVDAEVGAFVQGQYASGVAPELFVIGDLDSVWVLMDVDAGDLGRVHVGSRAVLSVDALPGDALEGRIVWVSAQMDPVLHRTRARCTFVNPGRVLRPEMIGTVDVAVGPVQ
jgi:cobalt-zinc-cadmium efflux system membrane fusion protein